MSIRGGQEATPQCDECAHILVDELRKELADTKAACSDVIESARVPGLKGCKSLVLFFETDEGREEFIDAFKEAKPHAKAIKI